MARVAIVTGGTRGIGEAISVALKNMGVTVAANYMGNDERAKAFTDRTGIRSYKWDVSDFESCQAGVRQVESDLGPVDILVNNAGITRDNLLVRMKDDDWDAIMATNLKPAFALAKGVLRGMMKARRGRIIQIGSVVGSSGNAGQANYAAAKAALIGFTKSLALEVGSRDITVNCVAPGFIDTDMTRVLADEQRNKLLERIPLGRLGRPEDIAEAVAYLASERAGYVTGTTLHVNGGLFMS
jgi:acetoacetyl-CoA reductase